MILQPVDQVVDGVKVKLEHRRRYLHSMVGTTQLPLLRQLFQWQAPDFMLSSKQL
jgi:hypothetical protein